MLAVTSNEDKSITRFTYIGIRRLIETETREHKQHNTQPAQAFPDNLLNKYLEIIGREVLRDEIPSLDEIEKKLQAAREKLGFSSLHEINNKQKNGESLGSSNSRACTIIAELEKKGYQQGKDICYINYEDGKHDIATWSRAMPEFLNWAFARA